MKKRIVALSLSALCITTAFAVNGYKKSIEVQYGIGVEFNGHPLAMTDVNGKPVDAFVYQGTTYVPIRALSDAFGADVSYDATTDAAIVYDDFSEICAVAHEMSQITNSFFALVQLELTSVGSGIATSDVESVKLINQRVNNMYDALSTLTLGSDGNANFSIIADNILDSYSNSLLSCLEATQKYDNYVRSKTEYNMNAFIDAFHIAVDDYYAVQDDIDQFFKDYCLWRDLGY